MALAWVVALAVGQAWMAALAGAGGVRQVVRGIAAAGLAATAFPMTCFMAYRAAGLFLQPLLGDLPASFDTLQVLAAVLPAFAITMLALAHAAQPWLDRLRVWRELQVQARGGFHAARVIDRTLDLIRIGTPGTEMRHA